MSEPFTWQKVAAPAAGAVARPLARGQLEPAVPRGARVQVVAASDDPLLSFVLDPAVLHRLPAYTPQSLESLLELKDFDYLALAYERGVTAPGPALHRIRASGLDEVAMADGLHVFCMRSGS